MGIISVWTWLRGGHRGSPSPSPPGCSEEPSRPSSPPSPEPQARLRCRAFGVQKDGNLPKEYEDAYVLNPAQGRFGIADGATEASFAGLWARCLVAGFGDRAAFGLGESVEAVKRWLVPLQAQWRQGIDWERLPYYAVEKARLGGFATFLGLQIDLYRQMAGVGAWYAMAIGDCCLFQVRDDALVECFPIKDGGEFSQSPPLLASLAARNERLWNHNLLRFYQVNSRQPFLPGRYRPGDVFFLTTDALGQWFLRLYQADCRPWRILAQLEHLAQFQDLVTEQRQKRELRNDDTTLIVVEVAPPGAEPEPRSSDPGAGPDRPPPVTAGVGDPGPDEAGSGAADAGRTAHPQDG